jgi:hypothetical protein
MWRSYVICVLIGLLLVSTGGNVLLGRQVLQTQADTDRTRQRLANAESAQNALQQQIDQLKLGATPGPAASPSGTPGARPTQAAVPTVAVAGQTSGLFRQIENDVSGLRGLQPKSDVPLQFLDQAALQRYFIDRFNNDYLPSERESDQKLLQTLGLITPNDNVAQTLMDVLIEQVIGVYDEDDKTMYIVSDRAQIGPLEKDTFAHEYTHALQDQYFDLRSLSPKHPSNDDKALANQALIEGDAVLMQRLWAQQKLSADEITELNQGGGDSKLASAPLFLREQLLFPYGDGFNFVRQMFQAGGGYPGVDEVFRNPPDSTEQILHPEKYRAHEKPIDVSLPDYSDGRLGPGWRTIKSNVLGELDLRLILRQLTNDQARAARSSSGWGGDRFSLVEHDGQQAVVIKTMWDSASDARNFFDGMGVGMKARFAGAREEEVTASRQALTASDWATDVRRIGATTVVVVIAPDRTSADALVGATLGG